MQLPDGYQWEITSDDANRFPAWGIRRARDGKLMARANAVQLTELESAPQRGWSFAIEHATRHRHPDTLCVLVADREPEARGLGLTGLLIERAKQTARELGLSQIIAPMRLNKTSEPPLGDVCSNALEIRAALPKWREWTGLALETSGTQVVPGLEALQVDTVRNLGTYNEPGIWIRYDV